MKIRSTVAFILGACASVASFDLASARAVSASPRSVFAAERAAVGGSGWNGLAAMSTVGTITVAGAAGAFSSTIDLRTGFMRTVTDEGPLHDVAGFDGIAWDAQGGETTQADLPGLQADAVTQAYQARNGWWRTDDSAAMLSLGAQHVGNRTFDVVRVTPRGGSPIDAWIDRNAHLLARTVAHTDGGSVSTEYSDYRKLGAIFVSYHKVQTDATGARTDYRVKTAAVSRNLPRGALARVAPKVYGTLGSGPSTIPFRLLGGTFGQMAIKATLDGRDATLLFDTGGQNFLTSDAARRLNVVTGGGANLSGGGSGSETAAFAQVRSVAIGSARLRTQQFIVAALPYVIVHPSHDLVIDGLVGGQVLNAFRTTIDSRRHTLTLASFGSPAPHDGVTVPFLSDGQHVYVRASIDGASGFFGIDTGDGGGVTIFAPFASVHGIRPGIPYVSTGGVGGTVSGSTYRGHALEIGGVTLANPVVDISGSQGGAFGSRSIAGNIGERVLDRFTLTFDYRARVLTFTPNDRLHSPFRASTTGIHFTQRDSTAFIVLSIVSHSPGDIAGLRPGDQIVAWNGRSIPQYHLGAYDSGIAEPSAPFTVTLVRAGKASSVTITPRQIF
jgi:aspartyl protease